MTIDIGLEIEKAWTVEQYVNNVDFSEDEYYEPSEFAIHFVNFIKLVNGDEGEENLTPVLHYRMLDKLTGKGQYIINMVFRGAAKTTLMGEYLFLYLACFEEIPGFGKVNLALYVSDSIDNGVKNMRKNLEYRWDNSEFLQKYIPHTNFTVDRWEFTNAAGHTLIVKGYGAKTGVRGAKEMGTRPQLAILDDLVSDEDAKSPTVIANIEATINKAIEFALHPKKSKIIWSGTPFNAKDPLYKAVESGAWEVNVYPVCQKFPCSREDFLGAWSDRFDYDYVLAKYTKAFKQGKVADFNQELMLRIMSDEERLVRDCDISWYKRKAILDNLQFFNIYITTDWGTSENDWNDYSVISVWAYNHLGDWFWLDGICKQQDMGDNVEDLFRLAQRYSPQAVGIEISGQQKGFIPWLREQMLVRNCFFTLASEGNEGNPGIRPNTNKMSRFLVMLPMFKLNKIYFPEERRTSPEMIECMEELTLAAKGGFKSKFDDFIDTISMLASMNPWKPSPMAPSIKTPDGVYDIDYDDHNDHGVDSYVV